MTQDEVLQHIQTIRSLAGRSFPSHIRVCTAIAICSAHWCCRIRNRQLSWERHWPPGFERISETPDLVIAPALGGILVAHEVAREAGVRGLFAERQDGVLKLRRGFQIEPGEKAYVVEDVVTTGGSTRETMDVVTQAGGIVIAAGSLIDRSGGRTDLGRAQSCACRSRHSCLFSR